MVKRYKLLVFSLLFAILFSQYGYCSGRYSQLFSNNDATYSLDTFTFNVTKDNQHIYFNVWIRVDYTTQGKLDLVSQRLCFGLKTVNYQNLQYSLCHYVFAIDGIHNKWMGLQYIDYDNQAFILVNHTFNNSDYVDIIPSSVGESMLLGIASYCSANQIYPY